MPTKQQVRSATFCRIDQLSLLTEIRDGPLRLFLMNPMPCADRHRHYDICGLRFLPWVLDKEKGWVTLSDRNLCTITPAGIRAVNEWEKHQFDMVDTTVIEPGLLVRPEPTAHLRGLRPDEMWPSWEAEWNARQHVNLTVGELGSQL